MILFVSDMHFSRRTHASERALIACLEHYESTVERLYLVGDVFDEFIEYRRLIPKGCTRFLGLLSRWSDSGTPVTYLVGNHDPWHRDYFETELGVRVVRDALVEEASCRTLHIEHGDGIGPRANRPIRRLMRHPLPVWLYRSLLPGDLGMSLAELVNRRVEKNGPDPRTMQALTDYARHVLASGPPDLVVMGHTHNAQLCTWADGVYLNTGAWYEHHTFGALDTNGVHLLRWNGHLVETVAECG